MLFNLNVLFKTYVVTCSCSLFGFFPLSSWSEIMPPSTKGENTVFWQWNRYFYELLTPCPSGQELKSSSLLSENQLSSQLSVSQDEMWGGRSKCHNLINILTNKKNTVALYSSLYVLKKFIRWFISSKAIPRAALRNGFAFSCPSNHHSVLQAVVTHALHSFELLLFLSRNTCQELVQMSKLGGCPA